MAKRQPRRTPPAQKEGNHRPEETHPVSHPANHLQKNKAAFGNGGRFFFYKFTSLLPQFRNGEEIR
jgi:hypothetical protein